MAHTIKILGTIVDAWFDHDYFAAEIGAGIITPSSRFIRDLRAALDEDEEPVEIYINSTGGDVFAGSEMLAAIQDAGDRVERVTVGGLAASMAANIAIMSGRPLSVHTNSLLYFHSATSIIWGGPGAHEDEAEMLDRINAPMIAKLKEVGVPAARVNEGFEEGRNMVLGADECAQYLGADIIGATAAAPAKPDADTIARIETPAANLERLADYTATLRRVAKCAAWAPDADANAEPQDTPAQETPETGAESAQDAPGGDDGANTSPDGETPADAQENGNPGDAEDKPANDGETEAAENADAAEHAQAAITELERSMRAENENLKKQLKAVQSGAQKKINELQARLADAEKAHAKALADLEDFAERVRALTASRDAERNARAELVGNVLAPESDIETPATDTPHSDRLASIRSLDERLAYMTAHRDEIAAERNRMH